MVILPNESLLKPHFTLDPVARRKPRSTSQFADDTSSAPSKPVLSLLYFFYLLLYA